MIIANRFNETLRPAHSIYYRFKSNQTGEIHLTGRKKTPPARRNFPPAVHFLGAGTI